MSPRHPHSAPSLVTLEVAPRTAKLLAASGQPPQIQRMSATTLPEETDELLGALRALLASQPAGAQQVGLLFGRSVFTLRTLELPSGDPKEIASMLELQLGKLTPYPRSEILFGWAVIGSFREGYTSVLLAIARKALIDGVLQLLKTKALSPQWVGVTTEGLEAWWGAIRHRVKAPEGQLIAVIDVDFASTDCAILSAEGRLVFTHQISIGYDQIRQSEPATLRWVAELLRLPRILVHEEVRGRIGRGVVTGVTENLGAAIEQLGSQWGVTVDAQEALEPSAPALVRERARVTHASFAALIGILASGRPPRIDLIPEEARVSQALQVRSKHLARLAATLVASLALAAVFCWELVAIQRNYLGQLRQRLLAIQPVSQQVLQRQRVMRQIRDWVNPARGPLEVFRSVAAAADPEIVITQVAMKDGKPAVIRGRAATMAGAFAFADRLKREGAFQSVTAHPILKPKGVNELGADFEISCEWAPPGGP